MNAQDIKTVKLVINSDQAQQKLDDINKKLETARQKRAEAFERGDAKALQTYTREVKNLERQAKRMQSRAQTVEKVLKNLDKATPKELKETIKEINKELESGNVERGSEQWKTLTRALAEARTELNKISEETKAAEIGLDKWGNKWVGFSTIITYAKDALSNALNTMQGYVEEFAEMDEHLANVTKYTGMSREEVEELNEAFKRMDTRTSRAALNDLAADAGRLGIQSKQQVLDFVDAANVLNVALGEDLGEDAVKNIGKLAQLFGDSERMGLKQAMLATGSTINELAQSSSANEGYIMDFTARLSGMARQAGMTQAQVMGLASVMDQSMVNAEEGSTALNRLIQELYTKPAEMAKAVGLDVKKFTTLVKQDANAALLDFASAAQKLGGMDALAPRMAELQLTGVGVTKVITSLANNLELVRNTQLQATEAFSQADSVQKEYDKANKYHAGSARKIKTKAGRLAHGTGREIDARVYHSHEWANRFFAGIDGGWNVRGSEHWSSQFVGVFYCHIHSCRKSRNNSRNCQKYRHSLRHTNRSHRTCSRIDAHCQLCQTNRKCRIVTRRTDETERHHAGQPLCCSAGRCSCCNRSGVSAGFANQRTDPRATVAKRNTGR